MWKGILGRGHQQKPCSIRTRHVAQRIALDSIPSTAKTRFKNLEYNLPSNYQTQILRLEAFGK
jgi:hypothetical protein